jgi:hypothetical protein
MWVLLMIQVFHSTRTSPSRGLSLLPKRHHLSHLRSFCDRYIAELLKVKHEQSTAYGEYIHSDYERQLRFLIEQYGLTDTAASRD